MKHTPPPVVPLPTWQRRLRRVLCGFFAAVLVLYGVNWLLCTHLEWGTDTALHTAQQYLVEEDISPTGELYCSPSCGFILAGFLPYRGDFQVHCQVNDQLLYLYTPGYFPFVVSDVMWCDLSIE